MAAAPVLRGRRHERDRLDQALRHVRGGGSAVLVLRGEAGVGKSTLLRYAEGQATRCRIARLTGVESELELPFAALHQLCAPMLASAGVLPAPQRHALNVTFGHAAGSAPDRLVLGLAVLSLLAEAASERPLVCLIDDAQWLDVATGQVLGFVARRLLGESVLLLFAVREPAPDTLLTGLPSLAVEGLDDSDARALVTAANPGRLDSRVLDRIVSETRGNPLALLELSRSGRAELLGGFALPAAGADALRDRYERRVRALPEPTRRLLLLASADPTGDATLLWRAAQGLGLGPHVAAPAEEAQLVEIGRSVRFRHPLMRSAAYAAGAAEERRAVHRALADALESESDRQRRVWHLAAAADGPDDRLAAELADAAQGAESRGGVAAGAALLRRSAELTVDPGLQIERTLAAARAGLDAGDFALALALLARAEALPVDDLQGARIELIRGLTDRAARSGREAPAALLRAARRLQPLDGRLARHTFLDAWGAALVAGRLAHPGSDLAAVSAAACEAPPAPGAATAADHLLDGLAVLITGGTTAARPMLGEAVTEFLDGEVPTDLWLHCGVLVANAALSLWDYDRWEAANARHVELARAGGALAPLANALNVRRVIALWRGDVEHARELGMEESAVKEATGTRRASYGDLFLLAYQGHAEQALPLLTEAAAEATARGEGLGLYFTDRATALLHLGLGHYAEAAAAAGRAATGDLGPFTAQALPDLVEAAVRGGATATAETALVRLAARTEGSDQEWALGLQARSQALLSDGEQADRSYAEAVDRLGRTRLRFELARTRLVYGEWLRRQRRRTDARGQLKQAFEEFTAMGADGFAERARHELLATGEKVRKRTAGTVVELTPQEEHIARLAKDGRTNPEIGAELYLSARTVEWHLRKVFAKLGITSRRELRSALADQG
ncbi:LuxR family transcriptional regulator [Nonomuraea endophytica]|uniref:DNA-binding CsgD family transcriptional regulator n=1 Tax=Nonomuraea endophytica TaxID=714136 RepID=A0A7W8ADJ1_9ACTN|nr:LuxR family transcriptional regulator [Nonomuraea endophytica]MBB5083704.1 DNA-binding CsgD family transcriptional regulator [Nonomuraea endophytica]